MKAQNNPNEFLGVGFFIHPIPAAAVAVLLINDHFLKLRYPGALTGKLSDFAGVFFFPLFLIAIYVLILRLFGRRRPWIRKSNLLAAIVITDAIFLGINLAPTVKSAYETIHANLGIPAQVTMDATDAWAIIVNALTYYYGSRFFRSDQ